LAVEAIGHFLNAAAEIECMPVEFRCRTRGGLKGFTAADFQVFPAAFPREPDEAISYCIGYFWIKDERLAHIAEWEADTAPSSERTVHFHQRYQRGQPASAGKLKVKGLMVVSLMKHFCPGTGVKATGVAM
jgi:hypothetical protein